MSSPDDRRAELRKNLAAVRSRIEQGCAAAGRSGTEITLPALTDIAVRWHFIGQLQTNKARSVARYADLVHSVDRQGLADALEDGARRAGRPALDVLVQLNLDPEVEPGGTGRGGGAVDEL